ncbi:tyrosine-protein kinase transmembrane receptor Ror [Leptopilina boulardi]|uniref:tyrosine-protein kinase transmembrane receptor Ror n=1 Tax=Leptopilina boulardi TaxID=63433 RepID=UPI0021F65FA2|nr:tyrosine-protein kinase transmembrane receptor Ror [Leptopilina boulardi]
MLFKYFMLLQSVHIYVQARDEFVNTKIRTEKENLKSSNDKNNFNYTELNNLSNLNATLNWPNNLIISPKYQEGKCEIYKGKICLEFVKKNFVFIPDSMTQDSLENKLEQAFSVIKFSNEVSTNCQGYAKPSLCYSVFPICRDKTIDSEHQNSRISSRLFNLLNSNKQKLQDKSEKIDSTDELRESPITIEMFSSSDNKINNYKDNLHSQNEIVLSHSMQSKTNNLNTRVRRICREECEMLENELCRQEYAIAKRHPQIGQQVPLVECSDLPLNGTDEAVDCLSLGISTEIHIHKEDNCYWGTGQSYRGIVKTSISGRMCLRWSHQFNLQISDYLELAGSHSYCRNPGGKELHPWCYVDVNKRTHIEFCKIPKCIDSFWTYTIIGFIITGVLVIISFYTYCYKIKNSLRSIDHLPSSKMLTNLHCDRNIYNGCQNTTQIVEMNSLLSERENITSCTGTLGSKNVKTCANSVPQFSITNVMFLQELGEGAFGKVYKGKLQTEQSADPIYVAVKTLKVDASSKTLNDFKREVDLMIDLRHPNIICLLGVILKGDPMCMLFEYMTQGDLHEFLISQSPKSDTYFNDNKNVFKQSEFLHVALQIAAGMEYLANNHYVHRDLAARNCLVGDNLTVKISDFGLSRDIYSSDYYRVQSKSLLPVRWMPPESILYGKFTTESDVWSFGVVLWEIYSYGLQPYYGYNNQEVIDMIRSRQLLPCPEECPAVIYSLMLECWSTNRRPQFSEIHQRLHNWSSKLC